MIDQNIKTARDAAIAGLLEHVPADLHDACRAAFVRRGERYGLLLRTAPPTRTAAFAAWHAIRAAMHATKWGSLPNDCGVAGMMFSPRGINAALIFDKVFDATLAYSRERWHIAFAAKSADRCAGLTPKHSPSMAADYRAAAETLRGYL